MLNLKSNPHKFEAAREAPAYCLDLAKSDLRILHNYHKMFPEGEEASRPAVKASTTLVYYGKKTCRLPSKSNLKSNALYPGK